MEKPRRLQYLDEVVEMVNDGAKHAEVATELGIFKTEVSYAMRLYRSMKKRGADSPWVPMVNADQVVDYFKRVGNSQFNFTPLEGFANTRHPKAA